jgi:hypothetical protein
MQMKLICAVLVTASLSFPVAAQNLPKAGRPDDVGFSTERLKLRSSQMWTKASSLGRWY